LKDVSHLEGERDTLSREKSDQLLKYDRVSTGWVVNRDRLASEYNVVLPIPSIMENNRALIAMRRRQENSQTELAVKGFLAFIFSGILLLKLFEPASVRLYMSEVLQQEFLRYQAGIFDDELPAGEKSTSPRSSISPQRFYAFLVETWLTRPEDRKKREEQKKLEQDLLDQEGARRRRRIQEEQDAEQQEINDKLNADHRKIDNSVRIAQQLRAQRQRVAEEVQALAHLRETQRELIDQLSSSQNELQSTIEEVEKDIRYFDDQIKSYESQKRDSDLPGVADLVREQKRIREMRSDANDSLCELRNTAFSERQKWQRTRQELSATERQYNRAVEFVETLGTKIIRIEGQIMEQMLKTGFYVPDQSPVQPVGVNHSA
jgi:hypothetical protein